MKVLTIDSAVDVGDTVFLYENRDRVFPISRKKSFSYTSSDPFLLLEIFDKVIGGDDEDPIVIKYSRIKDLKTRNIFETRLSSLSLKPNDINKLDKIVNNILIGVSCFLFFCIIAFLWFVLF